jgi:beta-N-acetylhexosaminidase
MTSLRRFCLTAGAAFALASCSGSPATLPSTGPAVVMPANPVMPPSRARDTAAWVDRTLTNLSLRDRVAQMVVVWSLGDYTSYEDSTFREVLRWVEQEHVGGLTISLGTPIEVAHKLALLQSRSPLPLLISSDLEPSLMRLETAVFPAYLLETGGATQFPPAMAIAATGRVDDAYDVARAIAREGRAVGIHVNFAPTVDVNNNPNNPVIGTRSFGEDPASVARLSAAFVRGTRDGGLLSTAKHFPGHGDTDVDSHIGLPVVTASPERLRAMELIPFRAAIEAGVDLVMSAHIALPALGGDSTTPATLRPDVMGALLRDSLGFKGTTVTDALSMEGVGKGYSVEQSAVMSVKAGADILLKPNDVTKTIDAVVAAVQSGELTAERIDASVRRMLWLKARSGIAWSREVSLDAVHAVVGSKAHRAVAQDVASRAVTLLRDSGPLVPVESGTPIALVIYSPETEVKAGRALSRELATLRPGTRVVGRIGPGSSASVLDSVSRAVREGEVLAIAAYVRRVEGEGRATVPPHIAAWIDSIGSARRAVVIALGNPYVLRQVPRAQAYMTTFGIGDALEIAVARALVGVHAITGRSPVSLPGFFAIGDGLSR